MPQTARGRKTSSTRSRKPAGSSSRARARASSRSSTGGAAQSRKKKATTSRGKAKKKTAAARGRTVRSARKTTSRPRKTTTTKSAARKKTTRKPARSAAARRKTAARKAAPARKKAASRGAAAARRSAAASAASRNGRVRDGGNRAKDALLARRAETLDLLERSSDYGKQRLREDAEDLVDQATDSQARDVVYALSSAEGDMIKEIDSALERIDAGEYGTCVNCGEPIQKRRLEAVPWARLCVPCQELQEQGILPTD